MPELFEPVTIGKWNLPNRIVMAPMTRTRAQVGGVPSEHAATYYRQRASAGLIISEGVQPSAVGQGYPNTPGLHTPEQVAGWRQVADAVHEAGGRIVAQLMHAGRIAHPDNKNGLETVAPSAVAAEGTMGTASGQQPYPVPRALTTDELPAVIDEFRRAAQGAVDAGLDGVELHGANGYLLHQFLAPPTNQRTDGYGGSPAARARFVAEAVAAVAQEIGPERVGLRISPANGANGLVEDDPAETAATYRTLVDAIAPLGLAYLHILIDPAAPLLADLSARFGGPVIVNTGSAQVTDRETAQTLVRGGQATAVAVGRPFIANPDLVRRWRESAPLNTVDPSTIYGGGARGYTDYPTLDDTAQRG
ncbi:alkene reductase [Solwaraspora sp. WMMD406]|uniref:alkene reductase n=1 Tax=Solwaraspora sp. WMMD406 TaxID=3016095 RepID=UPI0024164C54|nr:alkene reductase [Solwaraspora sp. WMMD406]MDG4763448.1 alkene reductase [Solwaraspora sp. WMMD406]